MELFSFFASFINFEKLILYIIYAILGGLGTFLGWVVFAYNNLVNVRRRADEAFANVEAGLKLRYDLIPNLTESVRGYAVHERELLQKVTEARSNAIGAKTVAEHAQAENMLSGLLKSLFAVAESYPDLKASTNFLHLQRELSETENQIQGARRMYNQAVRELNVKAESIPLNFVAIFFRFKKGDFFEITAAEREAPKVKF